MKVSNRRETIIELKGYRNIAKINTKNRGFFYRDWLYTIGKNCPSSFAKNWKKINSAINKFNPNNNNENIKN